MFSCRIVPWMSSSRTWNPISAIGLPRQAPKSAPTWGLCHLHRGGRPHWHLDLGGAESVVAQPGRGFSTPERLLQPPHQSCSLCMWSWTLRASRFRWNGAVCLHDRAEKHCRQGTRHLTHHLQLATFGFSLLIWKMRGWTGGSCTLPAPTVICLHPSILGLTASKSPLRTPYGAHEAFPFPSVVSQLSPTYTFPKLLISPCSELFY